MLCELGGIARGRGAVHYLRTQYCCVSSGVRGCRNPPRNIPCHDVAFAAKPPQRQRRCPSSNCRCHASATGTAQLPARAALLLLAAARAAASSTSPAAAQAWRVVPVLAGARLGSTQHTHATWPPVHSKGPLSPPVRRRQVPAEGPDHLPPPTQPIKHPPLARSPAQLSAELLRRAALSLCSCRGGEMGVLIVVRGF